MIGLPILVVALADAHLSWTIARHQPRSPSHLEFLAFEKHAQITTDLWGALLGLVMILYGIWMIN